MIQLNITMHMQGFINLMKIMHIIDAHFWLCAYTEFQSLISIFLQFSAFDLFTFLGFLVHASTVRLPLMLNNTRSQRKKRLQFYLNQDLSCQPKQSNCTLLSDTFSLEKLALMNQPITQLLLVNLPQELRNKYNLYIKSHIYTVYTQ